MTWVAPPTEITTSATDAVLYLSLGLLVALFLVGAVLDWHGRVVARRLVPCGIGLGGIFFGLTELFDGGFIIFLVYEAAAMAGALAIYCFLAAIQRLMGAGVVAAAISLNLAAAGCRQVLCRSRYLSPTTTMVSFTLSRWLL